MAVKNKSALLIPAALAAVSYQCHGLKPRLFRVISLVLLLLGTGVFPLFAAGAKPDRIELAENWKLASTTEAPRTTRRFRLPVFGIPGGIRFTECRPRFLKYFRRMMASIPTCMSERIC
jgi:hypothetical protein